MSERTKAEIAREYYLSGYNCAQAVFAAFHGELGLDEAFALRLSSSFGGGMGGLREVCGAFSGMLMVLGAFQGYSTPDDMTAKKTHYAHIQQLAAEFRTEYGTLNCLELLKRANVQPTSQPAERTAEYYKSRPCTRFIEACAAMTERELNQAK